MQLSYLKYQMTRCASQIVGNSVVVGTDNGVPTERWRMEKRCVFRGNHQKKTELFTCAGAWARLTNLQNVMIDLSDPTKDQIIKMKNMAMINAPGEYTVNFINNAS